MTREEIENNRTKKKKKKTHFLTHQKSFRHTHTQTTTKEEQESDIHTYTDARKQTQKYLNGNI